MNADFTGLQLSAILNDPELKRFWGWEGLEGFEGWESLDGCEGWEGWEGLEGLECRDTLKPGGRHNDSDGCVSPSGNESPEFLFSQHLEK